MKIILICFSAAVLLAACGSDEKDAVLDGCACAKEIHNHSKSAPHYDTCLALIRNSEQFSNDYAKCSAMLALNRPDTVGLTLDVPKLKPAEDGNYRLVTGKDSISWSGQKVTGSNHYGLIKAKSGTVNTAGGQLTGGNIVLDMKSISVSGMDDNSKGREKLTNHLRGADFFAVEQFPEAVFEITSAEPTGVAMLINGNLTLKGKTNEAVGSAKIAGAGSNSIIVSGVIVFDRSLFDVRYGSGKFFDDLGDELILDQVTITYSILASK